MFTEEEMNKLKQSPYILGVTQKQISYGRLFFQEYWRIKQQGYSKKEVLDFLGLDPSILGEERVRTLDKRVNKMARDKTLYDADSDTTISISEQLKQKNNEIEKLRQENEFLKKKRNLYSKYMT